VGELGMWSCAVWVVRFRHGDGIQVCFGGVMESIARMSLLGSAKGVYIFVLESN
jgi:hypothetical protein